MVSISLDEIKALREKTGIGIMACREALEKAGGDFIRAEGILGEGTALKVAARADRETATGAISSYIHTGGKIGAMVELGSETDFVSRSPEFRDLARELAMQVSAMDPEAVEDLLEEDWIRDPKKKVKDLISELGARTKENIVVKRFCRFEVGR